MKKLLLMLLIIGLNVRVSAQEIFSITGKVSSEKMKDLQGATVFINGSQMVTATNEKGEFRFQSLVTGTYRVTVSMIGYKSDKQDVVVRDSSVNINFVLPEQTIALKQVNIGDHSQREKLMKLFISTFIGESVNAKACKLLNPEVLDFSTEQKLVKASSDQFLLIDNVNLGYRIKYLLREFKYNKAEKTTVFDGECIFENITGSPEQQSRWAANRQNAYQGSLMHYLRSMYLGTSRGQGFLTYKVVNLGSPILMKPNPADPKELVEYQDKGLFMMTYLGALYVIYESKLAVADNKISKEPYVIADISETGSIFFSGGLLDSSGKYYDYQNAVIQGFWGRKRLGDQLPYEYSPQKM